MSIHHLQKEPRMNPHSSRALHKARKKDTPPQTLLKFQLAVPHLPTLPRNTAPLSSARTSSKSHPGTRHHLALSLEKEVGARRSSSPEYTPLHLHPRNQRQKNNKRNVKKNLAPRTHKYSRRGRVERKKQRDEEVLRGDVRARIRAAQAGQLCSAAPPVAPLQRRTHTQA